MPARMWHADDRLSDLRPVVDALIARLRKARPRASLPSARARGAVSDRPQRPYAQIVAVEPDPDGTHGNAVLHDVQSTASFTMCAGGCGRVLRAPLAWCPIEWTCGDCLHRSPLAQTLSIADARDRRAGTIGGARPTREGEGCV